MPKNFDFAIRISIHAPREGSDSKHIQKFTDILTQITNSSTHETYFRVFNKLFAGLAPVN